MQARCPHCSNVFNTERAGIQFCPNCGQQINVPDPAGAGGPPAGAGPGMPPPPPGLPGGPAAGSAMGRGPVPWEERSRLGVLKAFFENLKMLTLQPGAFWPRMRPDGSLGDAIFFGWICWAIYGVLNIPLQLASAALNRGQAEQMNQMLDSFKDLSPQVRAILEQYMGLLLGGGTVVAALIQIVIYPVLMIVQSAILHLFAMIFGAGKNGFNATARVVGYSISPYAVGWVPICGPCVAAVYSTVLTTWGIYRAQDTTVGRAVAVVIVGPVLVLCCCAGAIGVVAAMAGAGAANVQ